jgi:Rod binding domain-containing protein
VSESMGLPPIDQSLLPASVRAGGAKSEQLYDQALSFESMLDQQLTQSLADSLQPPDDSDDGDDDSDSGGDAVTSTITQMLPQALSQGLMADGGLGLASQIYDSIAGNPPGTTTDATNGSNP